LVKEASITQLHTCSFKHFSFLQKSFGLLELSPENALKIFMQRLIIPVIHCTAAIHLNIFAVVVLLNLKLLEIVIILEELISFFAFLLLLDDSLGHFAFFAVKFWL